MEGQVRSGIGRRHRKVRSRDEDARLVYRVYVCRGRSRRCPTYWNLLLGCARIDPGLRAPATTIHLSPSIRSVGSCLTVEKVTKACRSGIRSGKVKASQHLSTAHGRPQRCLGPASINRQHEQRRPHSPRVGPRPSGRPRHPIVRALADSVCSLLLSSRTSRDVLTGRL